MSELKSIINEFHQGQKMFGEDIARLVNSVLLTVVYFIGVGITWILTCFNKEEILELKINPGAGTYWKDINLTTKPIKEYYRQF
ncbi:hypothetical protein J4423_02010 [Candidatus Pacearchaeota archaeon]|nr:hypothetical protein [Candidatus Pacearchaeota archaeon]